MAPSRRRPLNGLKFAVFGFGSRAYAEFNAAAIRADRLMATAGAERLHTLGLGDDSGKKLKAEFAGWRKAVWSALSSLSEPPPTPPTTRIGDGAEEPMVESAAEFVFSHHAHDPRRCRPPHRTPSSGGTAMLSVQRFAEGPMARICWGKRENNGR